MRPLFLLSLALAVSTSAASADSTFWWPEQKLPASLLRTTPHDTWKSEGPDLAVRMMLQSVAGLAAKAVNTGTSTELLWISSPNKEVEGWGQRFLADNPSIKLAATLSPWELVARFQKSGVIKGYILYNLDKSKAPAGSKTREDIDNSSNVATSLAGILDGIIIDESLESQAIKAGLKLLADVRGKSLQWCFETYRDQFSRDMLLAMDPKMVGARDYAISQKCFALFGHDDPLPAAFKYLNAPAPILGWIGGDEFYATRLASIFGHFQTATSQDLNLPVLTAGSRQKKIKPLPLFNPRAIDFSDARPTTAFTNSDGDNFTIYYSNFLQSSSWFWANPSRGKIPFGWSAPLCHAIQLAPQTQDFVLETMTPNDTLIEWQGGYYYPDLFATERGDQRWPILATQAQRTWSLMQRAGTNLIAINIRDYKTPAAQKSLETFIAQTDGLLAILLFQYSPYNAGQGEVLWFKDKRGIDTPVITLRYQIWWNIKNRPNTGNPIRVAHEIIKTSQQPETAKNPHDAWSMISYWAYFKKAPAGSDSETAENLPKKTEVGGSSGYEKLGAHRGLPAVLEVTDRLPENIRVVTPAEVAWRIRMKHNPAQTQQLIQQFPKP